MGVEQTATGSALYTTVKEPEVVIIPKYNAQMDSTRLLANPADFVTIDKWASDLGFNGAKMVLALWDALNKGR